MRSMGRCFAVLGSFATAIALATPASAEPNSTLPDCQSAAGGTYTGTGLTQCQSPGNVQINATAPEPAYPYPWDDEFYGAPLIIAPGGWGPHGGGGGGGGGGHGR